MEIENTLELLCIRGKDRNYAFEFSSVKEICPEQQISRMPCLPPYFVGVCNYKGEIAPVIHIEGVEDSSGRRLIFMFEYQGFQLGVSYVGEPYILSEQECRVIKQPEGGNTDTGIWAEKQILEADGKIYVVMDVEKIILNLARYFQEEYLRY